MILVALRQPNAAMPLTRFLSPQRARIYNKVFSLYKYLFPLLFFHIPANHFEKKR